MTTNHARKTLPVLDELKKMTGGDLSGFTAAAPDGGLLLLIPSFYEDPKTGNLCVELTEDGRIAGTAVEIGPLEDAWNHYMAGSPAKEEKPPPRHRQNRTRRQALETGAIPTLPDKLALPSRKSYEKVLSTIKNPTAYLLPIAPPVLPALHYKNGTVYALNIKASKIGLERFRDKTPEAISGQDFMLLHALYAIMLQETMDEITDPDSLAVMFGNPKYLDHSVTIYIPALLKSLGHKRNSSKDEEDALLDKIKHFECLLGCIWEKRLTIDDKYIDFIDYYPVMQLRSNERSDNTITFASPYMRNVIRRILNDSLKTEKNERTRRKRNDESFFYPNHCYLVKSGIAKERNKKAAEIVSALAVLIAQAGTGKGKPHIKVWKLIDRCPELKRAFDDAPDLKRKNTVLRRAFTGAWRMMKTQTTIQEDYKEVEFPTLIPSTSDMYETIEIPHKGRNENE